MTALLLALGYAGPASWTFDLAEPGTWVLRLERPYGPGGGLQRVRFGEPGQRCDFVWPGITRMGAAPALVAAARAVLHVQQRMTG